jgi:hypothetical protein
MAEPAGLKEFLESKVQESLERRTATVPMVVWKGSVYQFGEWVEHAFKNGKISATSFNDALKKMCGHFVQEDGKPLKPLSVQQSLNQYRTNRRSSA